MSKQGLKKTGGSQAFQDQQIQKFSQFFQLLLQAKHRHVTPAMWAPWKTLACCSITSYWSRKCQTFKTDPCPPHLVSPPLPRGFFVCDKTNAFVAVHRMLINHCNFHATNFKEVRHLNGIAVSPCHQQSECEIV